MNAPEIPSYVSLAMLCVALQASPARVRKALAELGVRPALELNGVPHYSGDVLDRLFPLVGRHVSPMAGINTPVM